MPRKGREPIREGRHDFDGLGNVLSQLASTCAFGVCEGRRLLPFDIETLAHGFSVPLAAKSLQPNDLPALSLT